MGCNSSSENNSYQRTDHKKNIIPYVAVALKSPHGTAFQHYDATKIKNQPKSQHSISKWVSGSDINIWLQSHYTSKQKWKGYAVYNDQTEKMGLKHSKKGHCKGIVAWNEKEICWLVHSVPEFPALFDGMTISELDFSELLFGQSFMYTHIHRKASHLPNKSASQVNSGDMLEGIFTQLHTMDANIYISCNIPEAFSALKLQSLKKHAPTTFTTLSLVPNTALKKKKVLGRKKQKGICSIIHVSKSAHVQKDIYGDYLSAQYNTHQSILVSSWIRGNALVETNLVKHTTRIRGVCNQAEDAGGKMEHFQSIKNTESTTVKSVGKGKMTPIIYGNNQDHSKWAMSNQLNRSNTAISSVVSFMFRMAGLKGGEKTGPKWICVGDLNRMSTQQKRGGGGIVVADNELWAAFDELIVR